MSKKNKDPHPITDVYHVTDTLVDAATVVVTDLCENLSNSIDTHCDDILENLKKINTKKFNSISVGNSADGVYPVWVGVDKFNKVRKIFADTNGGLFNFDFDREKTKKLVSWSWNKRDMNDQFFSKSNKNVKRQKIFDMRVNSGAIAIADHGGHFRFEHHDAVIETLNEKYFKINNIYQNNYPIGLFIFNYGDKEVSKPSSFKSSKIHDEKVVNLSDFKSLKYTEFLSNLLDENCYPTKYIFEKYLVEEKDYEDKIQIKISDEKISANYLSDRLPKALQILKKQNKILFGKNFKEVHEIRKSQFENFIHGIIRDIEPQELNLPTFGRKKSKPEVNNKKLNVETPGLPDVQETFYDGYKLKSEPSLSESATIPVKNGKYPCYVHTYPDLSDEDDYQFNFVKIVVEGIENCYLNRNSKGQVFFDKSFRKSLFLREHINKKSNKISIDRIDLRNSETLKELEKISFVEEIELHGFKNIKNWDGLSKLKNLKKLKLVSCDVSFSTTENFFKNLYSLKNLEEFTIDDTCDIPRPNKSKFPKDLYLKKLKSFKIDFREEWKKSDHESYPKHKGYGNDKVWFICSHLPNIYQFPNFEKFKSLEKLRIYNYFDPDQKEGSLFNYEYGFEDYYQSINQLCKNSKIKDIWIYGYNFKQSNELASTRFLDAVLKLTKDTTVKVNGINKNTLKNISEKPISSTSVKINRLELVCKVEEIYDPKLISHENDKVVLNYFANIQDNENRGLLNDCFSQDIEEIVINPTYQFIRSEMDYVDTYAPLKEHLKRNKKLKKIIFKFDENDVSGDYGGMSGYWGDYESTFFNNIISELLTKYPNLKIILQHDSFNEALTNNTKIGFYIKIFEMFRILNENTKTKNRFEILGFNINSISKILEKYFLDIVDTLVVIEDNMGWNESKDIRDIEFFDKYKNFESPNPFPINLGTKNIELSYEGTKPYIKESKFINRMFEHETFWSFADNKYYHFLNDKIEGYDADKPIIIVKQKYLDRTKSTIFKNIKHYFYFAEVDYTSDEYDNIHYKKFWKDKEYFKFPKSVKFNKLETLNIFGGRDVKLNNLVYQVDCSNLKQLILCRCIDKDRTFPILPNLENLIIENKYTQKAKPYSKLSNLPKIKHLEFLVLFNYNDTNSRWNAAEFDFTDIYKLSNLSYLKMRSVNPEYMPPLKTLKNLEELELSFKLITGDMGSDDGIINENLADKDFEFLHHLKKLKKLDLDIPHDESDIIGPLLLSYVNPGIEELVLDLHYYDQDINNGYETIKYITKHLKNLRKLKLIMGRKEKFETSRKKKFIYFRKTGEKWEEGKEGPRPFILDLNKFTSLKKLEKIEFRQYWEDDMGYKVINPIKITKLRKIKKIIIDDNKFSSEDLIKIRNITEGPRDKFLEACKKKDKSIKNEYSLSKKDKKKYDLLDKREIKFNGTYDYDWSGDTIEDILKKRKKKKN